MSSTDRVLLESVSQMTLYPSLQTTSRRGETYPQIECKGLYCDLAKPEWAVCDQMGRGVNGDLDWSCKMDLPSTLRLSETKISCEGWDGPGDDHVVDGSCSLSFSLTRLRHGLDKGDYDSQSYESERNERRQDKIISTVFVVLFSAVSLGMAYTFIRSCLGRNFPGWRRLPPIQRLWGGDDDDEPDDDGHNGHDWRGGGPGFGGGGERGHSFDQNDKDSSFSAASTSAAAGAAAYGLGRLARGSNEPRQRLQQHDLLGDNDQPTRSAATIAELGEVRTSTGIGRSSVR